MLTRGGVEEQRQVLHSAAHAAVHRLERQRVGHIGRGVAAPVCLGHQALRAAEAHQIVEGARDAQRAAEVGSARQPGLIRAYRGEERRRRGEGGGGGGVSLCPRLGIAMGGWLGWLSGSKTKAEVWKAVKRVVSALGVFGGTE